MTINDINYHSFSRKTQLLTPVDKDLKVYSPSDSILESESRTESESSGKSKNITVLLKFVIFQGVFVPILSLNFERFDELALNFEKK